MKFVKRITAMAITLSVLLSATACSAQASDFSFKGEIIPSEELGYSVGDKLTAAFKEMQENNPISSDIFFADPTAVEYNGRLYIYGTNDSQEYTAKAGYGSNGYGNINTLACYSTDDMSNFRYECTVPVCQVATWAGCSWAPSIVARKESDGKTHFYLYFANSGANIGVLTSTSPTGPWTDPVGGPLIHNGMKGLSNDPVTWCFDPGVVIDENGTGWIAFGGGDAAHPDENEMHTGNCRIAKLGKDMVSVDSDIIKVPTYFHFEANELNYINGTYVLTYCSNYADRSMFPVSLGTAPQTCSMCYMTSKTPLVADSWEWGGEYLTNPNTYGYPFSNNHSHLQKFGDKYYLLYQNVSLLENMGRLERADGFRSIGIDICEVDEDKVTIKRSEMTDKGVGQIKNLDAFALNEAETMHVAAGLQYFYDANSEITGISGISDGDWLALTDVDFGGGANSFAVKVRGKGIVEVRLDDINSAPVASVQFSTGNDAYKVISCDIAKTVSGVHDVYLVFGGSFVFDQWQFAYLSQSGDSDGNGEVNLSDAVAILRHLARIFPNGIVSEVAADFNGNGKIDLADAVGILRVLAKLG